MVRVFGGLKYSPVSCFDTNRMTCSGHEHPCLCSFRHFVPHVSHSWWNQVKPNGLVKIRAHFHPTLILLSLCSMKIYFIPGYAYEIWCRCFHNDKRNLWALLTLQILRSGGFFFFLFKAYIQKRMALNKYFSTFVDTFFNRRITKLIILGESLW